MKNLRNSLSLCAPAGLGVLMLMAAAAPVSAATITYSFTGSVAGVSSPALSPLAAGDALSGTFVFDTEAAAGSACGTFCQTYTSPLQTLSATVGSYSFSATATELLTEFATFYDEYAIVNDSISGPPVNGMSLLNFYLTLFDPTHTALSTIHTLVPPVLGDYAERTFGLIFMDRNGSIEYVGGTIASLSVVQTPPPAVPEPTSLLLLGTGIAALAGRARHRSMKNSTAR
jgi:hypothetical protein